MTLPGHSKATRPNRAIYLELIPLTPQVDKVVKTKEALNATLLMNVVQRASLALSVAGTSILYYFPI